MQGTKQQKYLMADYIGGTGRNPSRHHQDSTLRMQADVWPALRQGALEEERVSDVKKEPFTCKSQALVSEEMHLLKNSRSFFINTVNRNEAFNCLSSL